MDPDQIVGIGFIIFSCAFLIGGTIHTARVNR